MDLEKNGMLRTKGLIRRVLMQGHQFPDDSPTFLAKLALA